jgi:catechol 2,3-dioxygenase-like lactoylglutathione lyase family enzyme
MGKISVRYIVSDVDTAIPFYTDMLGFKLDMHPAPGFAALSRGDLQLLLNRLHRHPAALKHPNKTPIRPHDPFGPRRQVRDTVLRR